MKLEDDHDDGNDRLDGSAFQSHHGSREPAILSGRHFGRYFRRPDYVRANTSTDLAEGLAWSLTRLCGVAANLRLRLR
jgi:hypothetical protein